MGNIFGKITEEVIQKDIGKFMGPAALRILTYGSIFFLGFSFLCGGVLNKIILYPTKWVCFGLPSVFLILWIVFIFVSISIEKIYNKTINKISNEIKEKDAAHQAQIKRINDNCKNEISKQGDFLLQKYEGQLKSKFDEKQQIIDELMKQKVEFEAMMLTIDNNRQAYENNIKLKDDRIENLLNINARIDSHRALQNVPGNVHIKVYHPGV
jgi:uncharacterized protein YukE